jgi:hypothetical protein
MALPSKGRRIRQRLMLDNVVGSQSELDPAPSDGGYGWVILFGVMMIQVSKIFSLELKVLFSDNVNMSYSRV